MSSIELKNVSLDYIMQTGSHSIKKSAIYLLNNCFRKSKQSNTMQHSSYRALSNINLSLKKGDCVGLLGQNGAGKSTLLKVLAKIYKPNLGEIHIDGKISSLFDVSSGMNLESTGYENIRNLSLMRQMPLNNYPNLKKNVETFTGLGDFLDKPVKTYSAGMNLKLAFAVATSTAPEIILIDEVIGVGDAHFMTKATQRLENMIDQSNILVLASHSDDIIKRFCNKVIVLEKGKVKFFGGVAEGMEFYSSLPTQKE